MPDIQRSEFASRSGLRIRGALRSDVAAVTLIFLSWLLGIVLVDPRGEFPSIDDWAYLDSVGPLVENGSIVFSDWSAQNLISHVLWGALFSSPFGASYTVLRASTLVAALFCALAAYRLVRDAGQPVALALVAAWLLLFNPIFFLLSFTYMTDVPFLAAQTGAMLFLLRGLRTGSPTNLAGGWTLAMAAQLSRQAGLAIPFAYGGAYLARHGLSPRRILLAALPLVAFLIAQQVYEFWLDGTGRMSAQFGKQMHSVLPTLLAPQKFALNAVELAAYAFFYLGLFLLPLSVPMVSAIFAGLSRKAGAVLLGGIVSATAALTAASFDSDFGMPLWTRAAIWRVTGLGDVWGIKGSEWLFQIATVVSIAGGFLLVICLVHAIYFRLVMATRTGFDVCMLVFGLLGAAASCGILIFVDIKFDRYILAVIPWLTLVFAAGFRDSKWMQPWSLAFSGLLIACMVWYSIVNTHNYMAEKRVWAAAIANLVAEGIPREVIDAGWVFNGDSLYGQFGSKVTQRSWVKSRDYVITGATCFQAKYRTERRYRVPRWPIFGATGPDILVCRAIPDSE